MSIIVTVLTVAIGASPAGGPVLHVDDDAPPGGNGQTWETAYRFLQDALGNVTGVTQVRVAGGLYLPDRSSGDPGGSGDRFATFQLASGIRFYGGYAGLAGGDPNERDPELYASILSGDLLGNDLPGFLNNEENSHHVVTTTGTDGSTELDGFTITAGHADGPAGPNLDGAGLRNLGSSPVISNCAFVRNKAATDQYPIVGSNGGGIYNFGGSPRIVGCLFDDNVGGAGGGGGMYNGLGNPIIIDCVFTNNFAGTNFGGAALANFRSSPVVIGCVFRDNSTFAGAHGGAVRNQGASAPMYLDCLFEGNHAGGCGGAFYSNGVNFPIVERCTFVDNSAASDGGAMCSNHTSTPSVRDCVFIGNWSAQGGGAVRFSNEGTIANCWLEGNVAGEDGGGLRLTGTEPSSAVDCVFVGNLAMNGGGASSDHGTSTLTRCVFVENRADVGGGGVYNRRGSQTLESCTFDRNVAALGGGIHNDGAAPEIVNGLFVGNTVTSSGGGVYNFAGSAPRIFNCTFADNAAFDGAGIHNFGGGDNPRISNCVLWGNNAQSGNASIGGAGLPRVAYNDVEGGYPGGVGNIELDPLFNDPAHGDYRLGTGSPCIDAGDNTEVPSGISTDLDGNPRFVDDPATPDTGVGPPPVVDMGAYEFQVVPACPADTNGDGTVDVLDLLAVLESWGPCPACAEDINGDGLVDVLDLLEVLVAWGPCA